MKGTPWEEDMQSGLRPSYNAARRPTSRATGWSVLALLFQLALRLLERAALLVAHLGKAQVQGFDPARDDIGHAGAGEPLLVGRDDVPGRPLGARGGQHVLVRFHVVVPEVP